MTNDTRDDTDRAGRAAHARLRYAAQADAADTGLLNLRWAQALADGLAAAGVRDLVLSPGARSTPLALAFLRQPAIRCHVILDERSAAFFALGLARAKGRPPALLCTSGSAPANWFPAVIEAGADGVPLVLLSADRPPEVQGWGANQTIDQTRLFGSHVRAFHAPGAPFADFPSAFLHHLAARAVAESRAPMAGPVHLNLAFREPLLPAAPPAEWPTAATVATLCAEPPEAPPDARAVESIVAALSGRRGVIVCGGGIDSAPFGGADAPARAFAASSRSFASSIQRTRFSELTTGERTTQINRNQCEGTELRKQTLNEIDRIDVRVTRFDRAQHHNFTLEQLSLAQHLQHRLHRVQQLALRMRMQVVKTQSAQGERASSSRASGCRCRGTSTST